MYRLKVISGPSLGKSFQLQPGETTVGRQGGNTLVFASSNVSKYHCAFIFEGGEVHLKDTGSANGTFVNGVLARERKLRVGYRISVGDVVLELKEIRAAVPAGTQNKPLRGSQFIGNVVPISGGGGYQPPMVAGGSPGGNLAVSYLAQHDPNQAMQQAPAMAPVPAPTDLKGKLLFSFENYVMPFFYGMNLKQEWKSIGAIIFGGFLVLNLLISVYPLIDSNEKMVMTEAGRRARFMARQLAERNGQALAEGGESRAEIGTVDREEGVSAYIVDLDNRIIAPGVRSNQYLVSGPEASFAIKMSKRFKAGLETGVVLLTHGGVVIAVEPIKKFDARTAKNLVFAMSVVAIDGTLSLPGAGGLSVIFSESFILSVLLAAFALFILYRLTLKPFEILNDDLDRVLRGETSQITHEFKNEDLDSLWDVLRSTVQRIPRGTGVAATEDAMSSRGLSPQEIEPMIRLLVEGADRGAVFCDHDRKIVFISEYFEEVSGIRGSDSIGQELSSVARDQAFGSLVKDLFERIDMGGSAAEEFEFNGAPYKIQAGAYGIGNSRGFLFLMTKKGDG